MRTAGQRPGSEAGEFRLGVAVFVVLLVVAGAAAVLYMTGPPEDLSELSGILSDDSTEATTDETGVADETVEGHAAPGHVADVDLLPVDVDGRLCVEVIVGDSRTVTCDVGKITELASPSE